MKVTFIIKDIKGKDRPRFTTNKYTGRFNSYTSKQTKKFEKSVREAYLNANGIYFGEDSVVVDIFVYHKIPKSYSKKKRQMCLDGLVRPNVTPDRDNIEKSICDALNDVAYKDDKQVVDGDTPKLWSDGEAYIKVSVYKWTRDYDLKKYGEVLNDRERY